MAINLGYKYMAAGDDPDRRIDASVDLLGGELICKAKTVEIGRLAVQTGSWPIAEIDHGVFKLNVKPRELKPVKEYLETQRMFRHVDEEILEIIQGHITEDWTSYLKLDEQGRLPWF